MDDAKQYEVTVFQDQISPDSIHITRYTGKDAPAALGWTASVLSENRLYVTGGMQAMNPEPLFTNKTELELPFSDTFANFRNHHSYCNVYRLPQSPMQEEPGRA